MFFDLRDVTRAQRTPACNGWDEKRKQNRKFNLFDSKNSRWIRADWRWNGMACVFAKYAKNSFACVHRVTIRRRISETMLVHAQKTSRFPEAPRSRINSLARSTWMRAWSVFASDTGYPGSLCLISIELNTHWAMSSTQRWKEEEGTCRVSRISLRATI